MNPIFLKRFSFVLMCIGLWFAGCVNVPNSTPSIISFAANATTVAPGTTVQLTAVFVNGTGSIDQNVGAVSSGVAKSIYVNATTTYTLTVTNGIATTSATETVTVVSNFDQFGIMMMHPTTTGGRKWFNKWGTQANDQSYNIEDQVPDNNDLELMYNGLGTCKVFGSTGAYPGQMVCYGSEPRVYVRASSEFDPPAGTLMWKNVEVTFYGKTTSYNSGNIASSWAGLEAVARTDHWPFDLAHDCGTAGYGGRMLFEGLMDFEKEVSHNKDSNINTRDENNGSKQYWPSGMPMNTWIGYKHVVRSVENDTKVRLELYLDISDGANGGTWQGPIISFDDYDGWSSGMPTACSSRSAGAILGANYTVYLRTDALDSKDGQDMQYYKYFSVREIDPLP